MEAELRASWTLDLGTGRASQDALDDLLTRHREPQRRYHTTIHVAHVLRSVTELLTEVPVPDPTAVRLATWFHDAIYEPGSSSNEADSATLAERTLARCDVDPERIATVARLVLATAAHEPAADDEAVLVDADLGILAAEPEGYRTYTQQVRAEYAHVDEPAWRAGRSTVLRSFLDRPVLFHTTPMRPLDPRARANLAAELQALGADG